MPSSLPYDDHFSGVQVAAETSSLTGAPAVSNTDHQHPLAAYDSAPSIGSGLAFLRDQLLKVNDETNDSLSNKSRTMLQSLLRRDLPKDTAEEVLSTSRSTAAPINKKRSLSRHSYQSRAKEMKFADPTMSDETVLQQARQIPSSMSLFASLLHVMEQSEQRVSARSFLKTCALTVQPAQVPAQMDAKEIVLAALHFLSNCSADCYGLPYVQPVDESQRDLEKQTYEKAGNWTLTDMSVRENILRLEDIFYDSSLSDDLTWMPRCRFGPSTLNSVIEEDLLWLKGQGPVQKKGRAVTKRKTPSATPSQKEQSDTGASPTNEASLSTDIAPLSNRDRPVSLTPNDATSS